MNKDKLMAVLCGSVSMVRCFKDTGIDCLLAVSDINDPARFSRYCARKRIIADWVSDTDRAIDDMIAIGMELPGRPVLYYGDDKKLQTISRNRDLLSQYYNFLMPDASFIEDTIDKARFRDLSARHDLPTPQTLLSSSFASAAEALGAVELPCLLKPNSHIGWFKSKAVMEYAKGQPQKGLVARTRDEFVFLFDLIREFGSEFVIQEYIEGGEEEIYSYHAYFDENSMPLACFAGRKIRTYPMSCGESSFLELVKEPAIIRLGTELLQRMKFVGPVKLDFKRDSRRNRYVLLEINARFTLWNYLGAASGINIPHIAHRHLQGERVALQTDYRTDTKWLAFGMDLRAFIRGYRPSGALSLTGWLNSLRGKKIYSVFAWDDPIPFLVSETRKFAALPRKAISKLLP